VKKEDLGLLLGVAVGAALEELQRQLGPMDKQILLEALHHGVQTGLGHVRGLRGAKTREERRMVPAKVAIAAAAAKRADARRREALRQEEAMANPCRREGCTIMGLHPAHVEL